MAEKIRKMTDLEELNWFKPVDMPVDQPPSYAENQKAKYCSQNNTEDRLLMNRKCEFCPQVFSHFGILLRHYKSVHEDKDFSSIQDIGVLLYVTLVSKLPEEIVICDVCGKEFSKDRLKNHQNIHKPKTKECLI